MFEPSLPQKLAAETIGTAFLVFNGVFAALFGFLALLGAAFVVAGATAVAGGDGDSWLAVVSGLQLAVLGSLGWFGLRPYQGPPPAAEQGDGAVALPLRPGQAVGVRVDADHRAHLEVLGDPEHLDHQVGADVARADDRDLGRAAH